MTWDEFDAAYNAFYPRCALDGHHSDPEERVMLEKHASRIELHRRIWSEVETKVTSEGHARVYTDFIGPEEARRRLGVLASECLASGR